MKLSGLLISVKETSVAATSATVPLVDVIVRFTDTCWPTTTIEPEAEMAPVPVWNTIGAVLLPFNALSVPARKLVSLAPLSSAVLTMSPPPLNEPVGPKVTPCGSTSQTVMSLGALIDPKIVEPVPDVTRLSTEKLPAAPLFRKVRVSLDDDGVPRLKLSYSGETRYGRSDVHRHRAGARVAHDRRTTVAPAETTGSTPCAKAGAAADMHNTRAVPHHSFRRVAPEERAGCNGGEHRASPWEWIEPGGERNQEAAARLLRVGEQHAIERT